MTLMNLPMIFKPCAPLLIQGALSQHAAPAPAPRRFLDPASSARTNATPSKM